MTLIIEQSIKSNMQASNGSTEPLFKLPWLEFGGTEIRCCMSCEEEVDEEEDEVAFAALDRGQPSVPGAERGRELVAQ